MEHYVTLFDGLFLPQGLALHASLQRHAGAHTLWVLCIDDSAHAALRSLALPNVRLLSADSVATEELLLVKPTRSRAEWCWTLTPFTPRFVFEADPSVSRVTYLDADLWLTRNPLPIFDEFETSGKAVLITEHAYSPEYDQSHTSGRFCVQFMTFLRDHGEPVRTWWADRCIEWCYARPEDGKFGDQKYLDDWPERFFDCVHVLRNHGLLQAPWNARRFSPSEAIAFHFHGLRTMPKGMVLLTSGYSLPRPALAQLYEPYVDDLRGAMQLLASIGMQTIPQVKDWRLVIWLRSVRGRASAWLRQLFPPMFMRL